jgi:CubicO group peptidase (beta-lactamase class C family)
LAVAILGLSGAAQAQTYPHASEPIGSVRDMYDGKLTPESAIRTFRNIDRLFPTRLISKSAKPMPLLTASRSLDDLIFTSRGQTFDLDQYLDSNRVSGLLVLKGGRVVLEQYRYGNSEQTRWMSMSVAKSITSTLFGAAVKQGLLSLADTVTKYVPALKGSAYEGVTVRQLLMMSSGVKWNETYTDSSSDRRHLLEAQIAQRPGALMDVMRALPRAAPAGSVNNYSTGETQVAGEVLTGALKGRSLSDYLYERVWSRVGMEADANWWLDSTNGHEIAGSGFSATLRDYGRLGQFLLNNGIAGTDTILPSWWQAEASSPKVLTGGRPQAYGYFWWTPPTVASQRDSAYRGQGIFGQHLYINPKAKVVIVVWSAQTRPSGGARINDWDFFDGVVEALKR